MRLLSLVLGLVVVVAVIIYFKNTVEVPETTSDQTVKQQTQKVLDEAKRATEEMQKALEEQQRRFEEIEQK